MNTQTPETDAFLQRHRQHNEDEMETTIEFLKEMERKLDAARAELCEFDHTFALRRDADMRAIDRWRKAHPGNDLALPDHADLVVWLLEELYMARANADTIPLPIAAQTDSFTPETDAALRDGMNAAQTWQMLQRLERERDEYKDSLDKCHDVLGESRDSDHTEIWKFFETHKQIIGRLSVLERECNRLCKRLSAIQSAYGAFFAEVLTGRMCDHAKPDKSCPCCVATDNLHEAVMGAETPPQEPVCHWKQDDDGNWDTGCGHTFVFENGTPSENRQRFCGYCGAKLVEQP